MSEGGSIASVPIILISLRPQLGSTARNSKLSQVQTAYKKVYGSGIEIFGVDDLTTGDYTDALIGIPAIPSSLE